jgi:hypothetical protein
VKTDNKKCLTINRCYETVCEKKEADYFFENQKYHKLSWKWWGDSKNADCKLCLDSGEQTWLGYLFEKYIEG